MGFLPSFTARDRMSKTGVQPNVPTKDVGFNCEGEVRVISQDVCSFGEGDVLKVLTIDLHDLKQDRLKKCKTWQQRIKTAWSTAGVTTSLLSTNQITHNVDLGLKSETQPVLFLFLLSRRIS